VELEYTMGNGRRRTIRGNGGNGPAMLKECPDGTRQLSQQDQTNNKRNYGKGIGCGGPVSIGG